MGLWFRGIIPASHYNSDLRGVPGSIPGGSILFLFLFSCPNQSIHSTFFLFSVLCIIRFFIFILLPDVLELNLLHQLLVFASLALGFYVKHTSIYISFEDIYIVYSVSKYAPIPLPRPLV